MSHLLVEHCTLDGLTLPVLSTSQARYFGNRPWFLDTSNV